MENEAEKAHLAAYNEVIKSLKEIKLNVHNLPAPAGEIPITWADVGDMGRVAKDLKEILVYLK